ncbi:MAG: hypothetical protein R3F59_18120 [Myxococcota bacterium]
MQGGDDGVGDVDEVEDVDLRVVVEVGRALQLQLPGGARAGAGPGAAGDGGRVGIERRDDGRLGGVVVVVADGGAGVGDRVGDRVVVVAGLVGRGVAGAGGEREEQERRGAIGSNGDLRGVPA